MLSNWLIRVNGGTAYVWKRQYFMGAIAIPWYFHGGTRVCFTPNGGIGDSPIERALDYIFSHPANLNERVTIKTEINYE